MALPLAKPSLIKVICESCVHVLNSECILCQGHRFYLWDPNTLFCYSVDGSPLIAVNDLGDEVPVTRRSASSPSEIKLDMKIMLEFIELWVGESPDRKWKISLDERGWHADVCFNRQKKTTAEISDRSILNCITRSYKEIIQKSKRTRTPKQFA